MIEIHILQMQNHIKQTDYNKLLGYITKDKIERLGRFHRFEDAQRSLLGDILARYAICSREKVENENLTFGKNEYGKPLLIKPDGIHFNISHSGNFVVCAIHNNPIGVDVETIRRIDFTIAENYFSREEYDALLGQPEEMRLYYFFIIWALKESYIKAEGKGLNIPLNSFTIKMEGHSINCVNSKGQMKYCFEQGLLDNKTIFAFCTMDKISATKKYWTIEEILEETYSWL